MDKKQEIHRLLQEMRDDLFSELDKRLNVIESQLESISEEIEKDSVSTMSIMPEEDIEEIKSDVVDIVSDDVGDFIVGEITGKLEEHITTEQVKSRKKIIEEIQNARATLRLKSIIWGFAVVTGGWLTWYGAWGIIGTVQYIQEPRIALVSGMLLLLSTGALHRKLIG